MCYAIGEQGYRRFVHTLGRVMQLTFDCRILFVISVEYFFRLLNLLLFQRPPTHC